MGELIFMRKRGITLSEFEKQKDEFKSFDLGDPHPQSYEEIRRDLSAAFNTLGLGVKDQTDLIEGG